MAFRMATPWKHPKTGVYWFRKRVPDDLRAAVGATIYQRTLRTKDPEEAKSRFLALASEIDDDWRRLRRNARLNAVEKPAALTKKQINGICGEFHKWMVLRYENQPEQLSGWKQRLEHLRASTGPRARRFGVGFHFDAELRAFLAERQIVVDDPYEYSTLVWSTGKAGLMAMESLVARTEAGDWSDHDGLKKFPKWEQVEPTLPVTSRMLVVDVDWEQFKTDSTLSPATVKAWRPMLDKLTAFVGRANIAGVARKQVVEWKDSLLAKGLKHKTVAEGYLAAARSFFNWALEREKVQSNPFADVKMRIPKETKLRPKSLQDEEARLILSETLRPVDGRTSDEFGAAKRWIPWIMAYTGARVNEITQMRGCDLQLRRLEIEVDDKKSVEDVWVLKITPEAGSVKNFEARDVPLHPHLVEQGFPDFVKKHGSGPVFYDPKRRRDGSDLRPQYQKVADKLGEWVREIGIKDEGVSPNHGWRHRFKTNARKVRMDVEIRDAIQGHKPRTEGEYYGEVPVEAKWIEIQRLPRIEVANPVDERPGAERRKLKSEARMMTARRAKAREDAAAKRRSTAARQDA